MFIHLLPIFLRNEKPVFMCIISHLLDHTIAAVHPFQLEIMIYLKT
jgi:hypothetical protein